MIQLSFRAERSGLEESLTVNQERMRDVSTSFDMTNALF
jgi:hypothetical protein